MNLKTFTASSMNGALLQVRKALGSDAVILHTRTYRRGGWLGFWSRPVVEITAADPATVRAARRSTGARPALSPSKSASRRAATAAESSGDWHQRKQALLNEAAPLLSSASASSSATSRQTSGLPVALRQTYGLSSPAPTVSPQPSPASVIMATSSSPTAVSPAIAPVLTKVAAAQSELAQEMQEVRRLVARVMHQQRVAQSSGKAADMAEELGDMGNSGEFRGGGDRGGLMDQYLSLIKQEVAEELADQIIQQVKQSLPRESWSDSSKVHQAIAQAMSQYFVVEDQTDRLKPTADGRPRTIALIGPTGVGKTTTLAKLAANLRLKQHKNVALVTLDTYRIAAVDQLRTYAQIIGLPLYVVANHQQMYQAMDQARRGRADVVLIDTAGRCPKDDPKLDELDAYLQIAQPHEVHLVLSSTSTQAVMLDAVDRFARIRTDRVIFTKLDEAVGFGVLLNVASKVNKRLSFITTGQEVPSDIEPATADRLASLVLQGER